MEVSVIIAAAGSGKRFGSSTPKQYLKIGSVTVLEKALNAFCGFKEIIVVSDDISKVPEACIAVLGGKERQDSINNALKKVTGDYVLIHDAARPFVTKEVIDSVVHALKDNDVALPCVRPKNTIRTDDETLDRSKLYEVQTPQGFKTDVLKEAYKFAYENNFYGTDDVSVVEELWKAKGQRGKLAITDGDYANIKITTPEDMPEEIRFGNGYDVHRLVEGRPLMLGCTHIPYDKGLLGHSDADVLSHAIADALLGAAALGDIGHIFPDSGPGSDKTEGMAGETILKEVAALVRDKGYEILMVDGTVVAEQPKLAPHITMMRKNIAKALGVDVDRVSVKATTEENMSDVSRNGMASIATCTLKG